MEGEAAFSLSQGDEEISSLHDSTLNSTTNNNSNNSTAQENTRNQGCHLGSFQLKVQILFVKLSDTQNKLRQRICLILPGYMQKVKRSMDFILTKSIAKFSRRSKRFAKLVADVNICILLKNECSLKSYSSRQK